MSTISIKAAPAETCSRDCCAAGTVRYPDPRWTSLAQSAAPKHESPRRATYQDVLDAPAHRVAEFIDGTLYTHPRPAAPHARASSSLGLKIGGPFDYDAGGPGGWWIIDEPELHLGEEIVVPDHRGMAPGANAGLSRHGVLHAGTGLGV